MNGFIEVVRAFNAASLCRNGSHDRTTACERRFEAPQCLTCRLPGAAVILRELMESAEVTTSVIVMAVGSRFEFGSRGRHRVPASRKLRDAANRT